MLTFGLLGGASNPNFHIRSMSQLSAGSCDYLSGGDCTAQSSYKATTANNVGVVSYVWVVVGATLTSGQGTDTITVDTTGSSDITFNVQCTVDDTVTNDSKNRDFTHSRDELTVPDAIDDLSGVGELNR